MGALYVALLGDRIRPPLPLGAMGTGDNKGASLWVPWEPWGWPKRLELNSHKDSARGAMAPPCWGGAIQPREASRGSIVYIPPCSLGISSQMAPI